MNTELEEQLNALIGKITNKDEFSQVKDQLLKRGIESLLRAEMTAHLGYQKGDQLNWEVPKGTISILIEDILYQPEQAGDFHL